MKGFLIMLMSMLMFCALTFSTNTVRGADVSETDFITTIVEADTPMAVQTYNIEKENVVEFTQPIVVFTSYESVMAYDTKISNSKESLEDVKNYYFQEVFGTCFISIYNYDI